MVPHRALPDLRQPPFWGHLPLFFLKVLLAPACWLPCWFLTCFSCFRASVLVIPSAWGACSQLSLGPRPYSTQSSAAGPLHYTGVQNSTPSVVRERSLPLPGLTFLLNEYYCKTVFLFIHEGKNFVFFLFFILNTIWKSSESPLPTRSFLTLDTSLYHSCFRIARDLRS